MQKFFLEHFLNTFEFQNNYLFLLNYFKDLAETPHTYNNKPHRQLKQQN